MERIPGYEILGELGRGGAGTVYLARQESLQRLVALKVLSTSDPGMAERLLGEAQLLADLRHPSIVSVYDSGIVDGRPWYSMTYCGGGTLAQILQRDGALSAGQAAAVMSAVAEALDALHQRGVVHRDVKPGNVLFDDKGVPHLGDLGTALDAKAERVTTSGAVLGTIGYTAPEMVSGGEPTAAADVFSLGVLGYEVLAGVRPFAGAHIVAVIDAIREGRHVPLAEAAPGAPGALVDLVEQALSVDPAGRPGDLKGWATDVRRAAPPARVVPLRTNDDAGPTIGAVSGRGAAAMAAGTTGQVKVEEQEKRKRRGVIWLAAGVAAAALGVGSFVAFGGGGDDDGGVVAGATEPSSDSGVNIVDATDSTATPTDDTQVLEGEESTSTSGGTESTLAPGIDTTAPPTGTTVAAQSTDTTRPSTQTTAATTTTKLTTTTKVTTTTSKPTTTTKPTDYCPGGDTSGSPYDGFCTPVDYCPSGDTSGNTRDGFCTPVDYCPGGDYTASNRDGSCNTPPIAGPNTMGFTFKTSDATSVQKCNTVSVFGNDYDPDGGTITAEAVGANFNNAYPNGTYYTLQANGTFTICATRGAANNFSALVVTYRVRDSAGAVSNNTTITITLTLT